MGMGSELGLIQLASWYIRPHITNLKKRQALEKGCWRRSLPVIWYGCHQLDSEFCVEECGNLSVAPSVQSRILSTTCLPPDMFLGGVSILDLIFRPRSKLAFLERAVLRTGQKKSWLLRR